EKTAVGAATESVKEKKLEMDERMKDYLIDINGSWTREGLDTLEVIDPANNETVGAVPIGGEAEANQAIEAAHHAFGPWSGLRAYERTAYLKRFNDLILENQEELAQIMTLEMGKPINESR